jgi:hypothetical protein
MNRVGQRLNQGGLYIRKACRHPKQTGFRDRDILRHGAVKIETVYPALWAEVLSMGRTITALRAPDQRIDSGGLTSGKTGNVSSGLCDFAAELMTQHQRRNSFLALAEEPIEVGTADAHSSHSKQNLLRFEAGLRQIEQF